MLTWTSLKSVYAMSNRRAEKIPTKKMAESNGFAFKYRTELPSFPTILPRICIISLWCWPIYDLIIRFSLKYFWIKKLWSIHIFFIFWTTVTWVVLGIFSLSLQINLLPFFSMFYVLGTWQLGLTHRRQWQEITR